MTPPAVHQHREHAPRDVAARLLAAGCRGLGMPGPRVRDVASRLLGWLWYRLDGRHRRVARHNLARAYGRETSAAWIEATARAVFRNIARVPFEMGWALGLAPETHGRHFRIRGREHLEEARHRGRGVLVLTAHLGNWELLTVAMQMIDRPHAAVVRPLDLAPLERFMTRFRTRFGAELLPKERAARRILARLRQGWLVVVLFDQGVDWYEGVFVDFFGRRACTSGALAGLAQRSGAPVVPLFVLRDGNGFRILIEPAVALAYTGDRIRDIEENTQRFNRVIERVVRRHPEQWFWVHRRWKVRPYSPWPRR